MLGLSIGGGFSPFLRVGSCAWGSLPEHVRSSYEDAFLHSRENADKVLEANDSLIITNSQECFGTIPVPEFWARQAVSAEAIQSCVAQRLLRISKLGRDEIEARLSALPPAVRAHVIEFVGIMFGGEPVAFRDKEVIISLRSVFNRVNLDEESLALLLQFLHAFAAAEWAEGLLVRYSIEKGTRMPLS